MDYKQKHSLRVHDSIVCVDKALVCGLNTQEVNQERNEKMRRLMQIFHCGNGALLQIGSNVIFIGVDC